MPKSLRCKIKKLCYNGALTEKDRDRILKALDQEEARSSSNEFFNFDAPMVKNSEAVNSKYHTCGKCKWEKFPFICHRCKWGEDTRIDLWELKEDESEAQE